MSQKVIASFFYDLVTVQETSAGYVVYKNDEPVCNGIWATYGGAFQMAFVIAKDTSEEERLVAKAISEIKKEK
jgi:hypothetical protein